jgi:hypothetical protein
MESLKYHLGLNDGFICGVIDFKVQEIKKANGT